MDHGGGALVDRGGGEVVVVGGRGVVTVVLAGGGGRARIGVVAEPLLWGIGVLVVDLVGPFAPVPVDVLVRNS